VTQVSKEDQINKTDKDIKMAFTLTSWNRFQLKNMKNTYAGTNLKKTFFQTKNMACKVDKFSKAATFTLLENAKLVKCRDYPKHLTVNYATIVSVGGTTTAPCSIIASESETFGLT
jgi:hypothetical protein